MKKLSDVSVVRRTLLATVLYLSALCLCVGPIAAAQEPAKVEPPKVELPKAEQIMDQYVEATGGVAAYDKINNRVIKSTLEFAGAGIKVSITLYQARPVKAYTVLESEVTGKIENGTDGDVVWELSAMNGAQLKEGKQRAFQLHLNTFDRLAHWRKSYKEVKTDGIADVAGKPCYKVIATPFEADPQEMYFDKDSHLLVKVNMKVESPMGVVPMEATMTDYKPQDGILIARKNTIKMLGQERTSTIDSVAQNVDLPADRFDPPAEIKALLKKQK